jgi:uncharacterized protein
MEIVGRKYEQKQLEKIFESGKPEFIAVYGRRRVGKTYLIREFFNKKKCTFFKATGMQKGTLTQQLENFKKEIEDTFYKDMPGIRLAKLSNWEQAFEALTNAITIFSKNKKVIIFLDELPWMVTPKSKLLEFLDRYWNRYWSENKNIKLIICGSAASWMIKKILSNTGGLYNRVTLRLPIEPFTLAETKAYLNYIKIDYSNEQVLTLYMCLGGIPYYLTLMEKGLSAIQNVNKVCFDRKGTLWKEFDDLFESLFNNYQIHEDIIKKTAKKRYGISRAELESSLSYKGGQLTTILRELTETGFIEEFHLPEKKERGTYYRIIDEYTLFYLRWVASKRSSNTLMYGDDHYWEALSKTSAWKSWAGYTFEGICFKHKKQIMKALHIPDGSESFYWKYIATNVPDDEGAQIDMIFDRPDNIINICEIKYCDKPFAMKKEDADKLSMIAEKYLSKTKKNKHIFYSIIASEGFKKTKNSHIITSVATLDDLFKE